MAQSWTRFSLASIRKQCLRSESNKPSETTCGSFTIYRPIHVSRMHRHKRWLGMWSKWLNLNSALGYHITPLSPIFLFILDSSASLQLCLVSASWFLSSASPHTRASPVMTCFYLAPFLHWPWALGGSMWLISSLGSQVSFTLSLYTFALNLTLCGYLLLLVAQPCLGSCSPWGWPWCSLNSEYFIPATFYSRWSNFLPFSPA